MPDHEEWLLIPVDRGLCRYESLIDGTLDLADVALLNDFLDVKADNEAILKKRLEENRHG